MQITCGQSFIDEIHVVLDDDEAAALRLVQLDEQIAQLVDEAGIDAGAGLVEQHEPRRSHERHRDVDELLLTIGQRSGERVRDVLQPEELDHLVGVVPEAGIGLSPAAAEGSEPLNSCAATIRLSRTESLPKTCSVWKVRPTPRRDSSSGDMPVTSSPQNSTAPGRRPDLAQDAVEKRRLARSVGSDHADDLAGGHRHRDAVDGLDGAVGLAHVLSLREIWRLVVISSAALRSGRESTAARQGARSSAPRPQSRTPRDTSSA